MLKIVFFSILLDPRDRERFAFTVPSVNFQAPAKRYHWKVLPQGMLNSPTLCQLFVDHALSPFRAANPALLVYHYTDDILVAGRSLPEHVLSDLTATLALAGLSIAPEKIQCKEPFLTLAGGCWPTVLFLKYFGCSGQSL